MPVPHQRLQHRLEMPWRQAVARRQGLGRDRTSARVERDIDDGGDRQNAFTGQKRHKDICKRSRGGWYYITTTTNV